MEEGRCGHCRGDQRDVDADQRTGAANYSVVVINSVGYVISAIVKLTLITHPYVFTTLRVVADWQRRRGSPPDSMTREGSRWT